MKLFIIGNGFDLAHRLPTHYWDFRTYLENLYPDFLNSFEQHYYIYPKDADEYKQNLLWNSFESNLANIDEDIIIDDAIRMDMGLESGDYGIEEPLRIYFREEYQYINKLARYLKQWVRTIKIRDIAPCTTVIQNKNCYFITFNYTSVLENIYHIDPINILHIHGSLHEYDDDPVLGHGNIQRMKDIKAKLERAETYYNEKEMSICTVIEEYYEQTFKDVNKHMYKLFSLSKKEFDEINIIGHSVAGIDLPYFKTIDMLTNQELIWNVYYHEPEEESKMKQALIENGISKNRIKMHPDTSFYIL